MSIDQVRKLIRTPFEGAGLNEIHTAQETPRSFERSREGRRSRP